MPSDTKLRVTYTLPATCILRHDGRLAHQPLPLEALSHERWCAAFGMHVGKSTSLSETAFTLALPHHDLHGPMQMECREDPTHKLRGLCTPALTLLQFVSRTGVNVVHAKGNRCTCACTHHHSF